MPRRGRAVHPGHPGGGGAVPPRAPARIHEDSELSIAGLQDKLLLIGLGEGRWGRPVAGRPSTHILKPDDRRYPGLVEAEAAGLALGRAAGVTTVEADVHQIGGIPCLIVSRFDRTSAVGNVARVHQEDACQALGRDPRAERGRGTYEDAGGPSLAEVAALLDRYATDPNAELDRLVAAATFTVIIGNADAHGKNLALLHPTPKTVELAPLHDTVPTALWPRLRTQAAMSVGGRADLATLTVDDLTREAAAWPHDPIRARRIALDTAERVRVALEAGVVDQRGPVGALVGQRVETMLRSSIGPR